MPSTKLPSKRVGIGETVHSRFSRLPLVAGGALFFLGGYSLARLTEVTDDTRVAARSLQPEVDADEILHRPVHKPRPIIRPFVMREVSSCSGHDPDEERTYRMRQAADLTDLLRQQARMAEKTVGRGGPEAVANALGPYTAAWADAVVRTAPDLAEELAAEMERTLCGTDTSDAQRVVVSRAMARMPELGNGRAFDCIVERGKEDAVLWAALDAWRLGTSPLTPELQALANTSKDERTLRRLIKQEDEREEPPPNISPEQQINTPIEVASPEGADGHEAGEAVKPQLLANGARETHDPGE